MACVTVESGPQVSLNYTEETDCGVSPPALLAAVSNVAADKTGASPTTLNFTIAAGDWAVEQGVKKWQYVETVGFADANLNGRWRVQSVSGASPSTVTVEDPDNVGADEAAEAGQTLQIVMQTLRATGRQLDVVKDLLESEEVRPSRQVADQRHGFQSAEGTVGVEMSLQSYSDMLRAAFAADDWEAVDLSGTGNLGITAATPSAGKATIDRATNSWADDGIRPGDIVATTGFANSENNRQWRVISVSAQDMVVDNPEEDAVTEAAGAGPAATYPGYRIDIGTGTPRTFTFQQRFDGVTQYRTFVGVAVNSLGFNVTPDAIVGGDMELLGMNGSAMVQTPINALDPVAAPTTAPFAAFDGALYEGGERNGVVTSVEMTLNNNYSLEAVVGEKGSPGVFDGVMTLEGTLTVFLEDETLYNKFFNETESSLWMRLQDPNDAAEFMNIVIPRVKYNTSEIDPPQNGPVPISMGMVGLETNVKDASGNDIPSTFTIQVTTV